MMSENRKSGSFLLVVLVFFPAIFGAGLAVGAETYHLKDGKEWKKLDSAEGGDYILSLSKVKQLIGQAKHKEAAEAIKELKVSYPELAGEDLDALVEAELLFAKKKYIKASRKYDEFLNKYPDSSFYETALERQYSIADLFLKGQKRPVLGGLFKLPAYEEADRIMHDIADRSGEAPIAKRALKTLAKGYQNRKKFIEAYDVWAEMSSKWPTGETGKEALLEMAQSLHSAYRGPKYDSSSLKSARSYYEDFKKRYPQDVDKYDIVEKIKLVDEQLAYKEFEIGEYYARAELSEAANLYYNHTSESWPGTTAAKMAEEVIEKQKSGEKTEAEKKPLERKVFDGACVFLDDWFGLKTVWGSK